MLAYRMIPKLTLLTLLSSAALLLLPHRADGIPAHVKQFPDYHQGIRAYKRRDYKNALYYFRRAAQLKQVPSLSHLGIGKALYRQDKFDQAKKEIDISIKLDPKNSDAYKWRGKIEIQDGKYKEAVESFTQCAKYTSVKHTPLKARAGCYSALGRNDLAVRDLTLSLKYGQDPGIYIKRAEAYMKLKQYEKAIADYRKGKRGTYNVDAVYMRIGSCYEKLGQTEKAINEYSKLIKVNPIDDEARAKRAALLVKQKKYKAALADCTFAIDNYPLGTPRHLHKLRASIYKAMGENKKAALDLKRAVKK